MRGESVAYTAVTAMALLRNLASELRADTLSAKAVPSLAPGFTTGLGLLVASGKFNV